MMITGFKLGSNAAASDFKVGDVITQIEDELLAGFSTYEVLTRLRGKRGSEVELVASRITDKGKQRITDVVTRDVSLPPMKAEPGIEVKVSMMGNCSVTKVFEGTDAHEEGLEVGDVITMIDDEFVSGLKAPEVIKMLTGLLGSTVELVLLRSKGGVKRRLALELVRDYNLVPMPLRSRFAETGLFHVLSTDRLNHIASCTVQIFMQTR